MKMSKRWIITPEERKKYIDAITPQLTYLRASLKMSQDEVCSVIGLSRQTYGEVERGNKRLSWNGFLSLIAFYTSIPQTFKQLQSLELFPLDLIFRFNNDRMPELSEYFDIPEKTKDEKKTASASVIPGGQVRNLGVDSESDLLVNSFMSENRHMVNVILDEIEQLRISRSQDLLECCDSLFRATWDFLTEFPPACRFCYSYYHSEEFRSHAGADHNRLVLALVDALKVHIPNIYETKDVLYTIMETVFSYATLAIDAPDKADEYKKHAINTVKALAQINWSDVFVR